MRSGEPSGYLVCVLVWPPDQDPDPAAAGEGFSRGLSKAATMSQEIAATQSKV